MSSLRAAFIACAIVASPIAMALAHVVAQPNTAIAGSSFTAGFLISHGCGGSPTVALRVRLPEGVTAREACQKRLTITGGRRNRLARQLDRSQGHEIFAIALTLPNTPGRTLYFPAIQECQQGTRSWIEIPAPGQSPKDLGFPAPFVTLTPLP